MMVSPQLYNMHLQQQQIQQQRLLQQQLMHLQSQQHAAAQQEAFLQQAAVAVTSTPEEMTRHLEREIGVWREVITRAKVTIQ